MKLLFLLLSFYTSFLFSESFSYTKQKVSDIYREAVNAYTKKQYRKAIERLRFCQENTKYARCSGFLATIYASDEVQEDINRTIQTYKLAIERGDKKSLHNLGNYYYDLGNWREAERYFKRSAEEGYFDSFYNLGRAYAADRNMTGALYYYHEASEYAVPQGDYELALYYYKRKEYDKTKFYFEKAANSGFEPAIKALEQLNNYLEKKKSFDDKKR